MKCMYSITWCELARVQDHSGTARNGHTPTDRCAPSEEDKKAMNSSEQHLQPIQRSFKKFNTPFNFSKLRLILHFGLQFHSRHTTVAFSCDKVSLFRVRSFVHRQFPARIHTQFPIRTQTRAVSSTHATTHGFQYTHQRGAWFPVRFDSFGVGASRMPLK
jgi:hypothetical protein